MIDRRETIVYYVEMIDRPGLPGWLRMTPNGRWTEDAARQEREALAAEYPTRETRIVRETTIIEVIEEHDSIGTTR